MPGCSIECSTSSCAGSSSTAARPTTPSWPAALGLSVEDGRRLLLDVMQAYPIGWLHPETDYVASFPPLNNLPTQYRVSVGGEQRWFAQCGFEATSVTWLFPGATVRIEAPCLDCGDPHAHRDARRPRSWPSTRRGSWAT